MTEYDKILPAIAKAMGSIKGIAKDSRNAEQKYDFASIDKFLAMANPICAENGLIFHMDEVSRAEFTRAGKYGDTFWILVGFSISVYHVSGQSMPPVIRSVEVIRSGAQAYGSAQSYCLKQFLRSLFLIPTGDKDDADFQPHGDGKPEAQTHTSHVSTEGIRDAWRDAVLDGLPVDASPRMKAEAFALAIIMDFAVKTEKTLDGRWSKHAKMIDAFKANYPDLFDQVVDAFENRRMEITDDATQKVAAE